jgi:hypothetical protein
MSAEPLPAGGPAGATAPPGLAEAERLHWRRPATPRTLRRDERRWTLWTFGIVVTFSVPSLALLLLEPLTLPIALIWSAHGWAICRMQARRGVRSVVAIGSDRSAARRPLDADGAERAALGLLGDLLDHRERELLQRTGLVLQRGRWGIWLVGEQGALLLRPGGRRIDAFCVRVAEAGDLPAGDRVAHLLLALREDEGGFATVANLGFSGAVRRCRRRIPDRERPALDAARAAARQMNA